MATVQRNHSGRSGPLWDKTPSIHSAGPRGLSAIFSARLCPLCQLIATFPWLGKRKLGLGELCIHGGGDYHDSHIHHLRGSRQSVCVRACVVKVNLVLSVLMHADTLAHWGQSLIAVTYWADASTPSITPAQHRTRGRQPQGGVLALTDMHA